MPEQRGRLNGTLIWAELGDSIAKQLWECSAIGHTVYVHYWWFVSWLSDVSRIRVQSLLLVSQLWENDKSLDSGRIKTRLADKTIRRRYRESNFVGKRVENMMK